MFGVLMFGVKPWRVHALHVFALQDFALQDCAKISQSYFAIFYQKPPTRVSGMHQLLQLESQLQCVHQYCLQRSQDPENEQVFVRVYRGSQSANSIALHDSQGLIEVIIEISSQVLDDDWMSCVAQILGPRDSEAQMSNVQIFSQKNGLRVDDYYNYTEAMQSLQ